MLSTSEPVATGNPNSDDDQDNDGGLGLCCSRGAARIFYELVNLDAVGLGIDFGDWILDGRRIPKSAREV